MGRVKASLIVAAVLIGLGTARQVLAQSTVVGSVNAEVQVHRATQQQSSLRNRQEANVGAVQDSTTGGSVDLRARIDAAERSQSGLLNRQALSVGSID